MKQLQYSKSANVVGYAIIGLALLLLLGSIATNPNSPIDNNSNSGSSQNSNEDGIDNFNIINEEIFEINSTILGREEVEIQNFPNIKIGSAIEYKELEVVTDITIKQSSFGSNEYSYQLNRDIVEDENFLGILIILQSPSSSFNSDVGIFINNELHSTYNKNSQFPIRIDKNRFLSASDNLITISTPFVEWYNFFSNSQQILNEIRIIGIYQDSR